MTGEVSLFHSPFTSVKVEPGINNPIPNSNTVCQKCLGKGHFTYECQYNRPYVSRPSRTEQLEKPNALAKLKAEGKPSLDLPEEFKTKTGTANKILQEKERQRGKDLSKGDKARPKKKARRSSSSNQDSTSSTSSSSSSDSDTSSSDSGDSDSDSESSRSRSRERKRRRGNPSAESDRD